MRPSITLVPSVMEPKLPSNTYRPVSLPSLPILPLMQVQFQEEADQFQIARAKISNVNICALVIKINARNKIAKIHRACDIPGIIVQHNGNLKTRFRIRVGEGVVTLVIIAQERY